MSKEKEQDVTASSRREGIELEQVTDSKDWCLQA